MVNRLAEGNGSRESSSVSQDDNAGITNREGLPQQPQSKYSPSVGDVDSAEEMMRPARDESQNTTEEVQNNDAMLDPNLQGWIRRERNRTGEA